MRRILFFLVVLLAAGAVRAQEPVTIAPLPAPPGEMVDVGGYQLHLYCTGEGSPTIILEPGFGRFSLNMRATQEQLSAVSRVCTYDHAGFGWSEPGTLPRTTQQLSDELAILLKNGQVSPPYVLVAHSLGGFVARLFVAQHADDVSGVLLLDATPPEFLLDPINAPADQALQAMLEGAGQIAQAGQWNQQTLAPVMQLLNDVLPDLHEAFISLATQPTYFAAMLSEWQNRLESAQQVIGASTLGDMPLIVLAAGERLKLASDTDTLWVRDQAAQATLSSQSELSFVVNGNHDFYVTQPQAVLDAVQRLIAEL